MEYLMNLGIFFAGLGLFFAGIAFLYWGSIYEKKIKALKADEKK